MKKRLAWFTSFDINSAIGGHSGIICNALACKYDITIFTTHFTKYHSTNCKVSVYDKTFNTDILKNYDYVIYDFGNNLMYHGAIFEIFENYPGVVIIHDQVITGLVEQYSQKQFGWGSNAALDRFLSYIETYYGEKVSQLFNHAITNGKSIFTPEMIKYSLLEHIIENAKGIFIHAKFFNENIVSKFLGPIGFSYLSCERQIQQPITEEPINELVPFCEYKVRIVSTGYVGESKRIDKIVDVLLENPELAENVQYIVVGGIETEYGQRLKKISENKLKGCLFMLDFQPTEIMESAIRTANLCINLRYPNTEVCSLSLFEQMAFGKPVLVIDSGIYGEMSDDCVVKINIDTEHDDIKNVINCLITDRIFFVAIGNSARNFIQNECTIKTYADNFHSFLQEYDDYYTKNNWDKVLYNRVIDTLFHEYLRKLCLNWRQTDDVVAQLTNRVNSIFPSKPYTSDKKTVGLWLVRDDYTYEFDESALKKALQEALNRLESSCFSCEILAMNKDVLYIKQLMTELVVGDELYNKIIFVDETNYFKIYKTAVLFDSEYEDFINTVVTYTKSDFFITVDVACYSVIKLNKPFLVIISEKLNKIISDSNLYSNYQQICDIKCKLKSFEREGVEFV